MTRDEITWPKLARTRNSDYVPLIVAMIGGWIFGQSWRIGSLLFVLGVGIPLFLEVRDEIKRLLWLQNFDRCSTYKRLEPLLKAEPIRYLVHYTTYFSSDPLRRRPAIVIEDKVQNCFYALYPGSRRALEQIRALGVQDFKQHCYESLEAKSDIVKMDKGD